MIPETHGQSTGNKGKGTGNGFASLGLSEIVYNGIIRMGYRNPTPVQRKALPVIMSGSDSFVMARTGSGKTCAFLIPMIEKLLQTKETIDGSSSMKGSGVRAIILSPTRELSNQTLRVLNKLVPRGTVKAIGIHGGEGMEKQFTLLASRPDVIIATPGRLAHHLNEIPDFTIQECIMFICDEADRLFEMGFAEQLRQIARKLPSHSVCQKVLVSATLPKVLVEFSKSGFCVDPVVVRLDQEATVSDELRMVFVTCRSTEKDAVLLHILHQYIFIARRERQQPKEKNSCKTGLTLIFAATRHHVDYISVLLRASNLPVTSIYGSMDHQARQHNLLSFRNGQTPILVVTDVAARGIDVPLIDHVIHYHFPAGPKLFVHRSGRAARAGRIGYAWAIPEPDEMPYMIDLLLFLGRKFETSKDHYTLESMTPDMVHYGCIPELILTAEVENMQRIMNSELTGSLDSQDLKNLAKVCNNAMKQYRKTRPEASKEAAHITKAVLEGERDATGQRKNLVPIPPHPLFLLMAPGTASQGLQALHQEREKFLEAMANFRPKETVFEALGTGKAQETSVVSHVDKGRTMSASSGASGRMEAIKNMRRQMKIARGKGHLFVAGTEAVSDLSKEALCAEAESAQPIPVPHANIELDAKRRISKAERRRLKNELHTKVETETKCHEKKGKKRDFRDPQFYMDNDHLSSELLSDRSRRVEAAMQPSSAYSAKVSRNQALRLEEAMIEVVGDENESLIKKQRMMRWDKAKRKYVSTTIGSELSGESRSKKLKLESGQIVKHSKLKLGELYQKWQKKCNKSIGRTGVFDANENNETESTTADSAKLGSKQESPRSVASIRKERNKKNYLKLKNMKRTERRTLENKSSRTTSSSDRKLSNVQWQSRKSNRRN